MKKYTRHFSTQTPQGLPIPESDQVRNRAQGWGFPIDDENQFERFLILGSADNTYYATSRELTRENLVVLERLLEEGRGIWAVNKIAEISDSGRAPKNDPATFALAACIKLGDLATRQAAAQAMPKVCRTATHAYQWANALKVFAHPPFNPAQAKDFKTGLGWSPVVKRAWQNWLDARGDDGLAYQFVKYRQREGWKAGDVLRKVRPKPNSTLRDLIYAWTVHHEHVDEEWVGLPDSIIGFEKALSAQSNAEIVSLIQQHRLPWEAIPSQWARDVDVQTELLRTMPVMATIRQLGRLSSLGLFSDAVTTQLVCDRITNQPLLQRARIHPMNLYLAGEVYRHGRGLRGKLSWPVSPEIVAALGQAFFASFNVFEPTGKNIVVGVDTSSSMHHTGVMGVPSFTASEAAFAMAYVTMRSEPNCRGVLFNEQAKEFDLGKIETMEDLQTWGRKLWRSWSGGTNCAAPIQYAHANHWHDVDAFCIYTDNETWYGMPHPVEAATNYRQSWNRQTKVVSTAFTPVSYSITPVDDVYSLAIVGMDDNVPTIIADFVR